MQVQGSRLERKIIAEGLLAVQGYRYKSYRYYQYESFYYRNFLICVWRYNRIRKSKMQYIKVQDLKEKL